MSIDIGYIKAILSHAAAVHGMVVSTEGICGYAFDCLSYAKELENSGISREHAEAHATATRQFIMAELITKTDLEAALERQTLRLTVRLGGLMIAGVGALTLLLRLGV